MIFTCKHFKLILTKDQQNVAVTFWKLQCSWFGAFFVFGFLQCGSNNAFVLWVELKWDKRKLFRYLSIYCHINHSSLHCSFCQCLRLFLDCSILANVILIAYFIYNHFYLENQKCCMITLFSWLHNCTSFPCNDN